MNRRKKILNTAVAVALGAVTIPSVASAVGLSNGNYTVYINTTPTLTTYSGGTAFKFGTDGAWYSSFTWGGNPPNPGSIGMTDNALTVTGTDGNQRGSSIGGDGYAGSIGISVLNNSFTATSFNVDGLYATAAGDFVQYGDPGNMTGSVDPLTGQMIFDPTGRLAAVSALPMFYDRKWNVDDCDIVPSLGCANNGNTLYETFSTASATAFGGTGTATIMGAPLTALGDVNGDGRTDYNAILVSGGQTGSEWGAFYGAGYFEVWNVNIVSAVPVPAAVWLFGSGLLGLLGIARKRRRYETMQK